MPIPIDPLPHCVCCCGAEGGGGIPKLEVLFEADGGGGIEKEELVCWNDGRCWLFKDMLFMDVFILFEKLLPE